MSMKDAMEELHLYCDNDFESDEEREYFEILLQMYDASSSVLNDTDVNLYLTCKKNKV